MEDEVDRPLECDSIKKRNEDCERMTPMEYQHVYQIKNLRKYGKHLTQFKEYDFTGEMSMYSD
mgnify:CR=1 FL=1